MAVSKEYYVDGMTCGHCVHAVSEELSALDGVNEVDIDLRPGEASKVTVTSTAPLTDTAVAAAVDEAGYELAQQ
jgi:copper chaperone